MSSTLMCHSHYFYDIWHLKTQIFEAFLQLFNICFLIYFQGSLIANMVMGILILKRKYTLSKYFSVLMITLGISICTIISGKDVVSILFKQLICLIFVPCIIRCSRNNQHSFILYTGSYMFQQ
jgi:hypothetical protein